ncbi:cytochrome P450 [Actinomadura sp. 6N118]|uniref:cytochrome P450 n=1 Tax=Actinomadura sp. 6N118 TaxID=3375151 RepID=UPI0037A5F943
MWYPSVPFELDGIQCTLTQSCRVWYLRVPCRGTELYQRKVRAVTASKNTAVSLPPGPRLPKIAQGLAFVMWRQSTMRLLHRVYGASFTLNLPFLGPTVVISEPKLIKQVFQAKPEIVGLHDFNLGVVLGSGSLFALDGAEHHRRRKLLVPPLHGRRLQAYETIMEEEVMREIETWRAGEEFETLTPMMRVTLNIILRAVFGAEGAEFEQLRELLPRLVDLGSKLMGIPFLRPDLGPWSPGGRYRAHRRRFDEIVDTLIEKAKSDPDLEDRPDVLSLLVQARYEDGEPITRQHLADELLTLLAAGHETTATTLAWAFERIRRHPSLLYRLAEEADAGGSELRQATILEVQRTRPVIDTTERAVKAPTYTLGEWMIPHGHSIMVHIDRVQNDDSVFPDAASFNPDRFVGAKPENSSWVPFGGGTRRCIGAAFATMELNVALRTILREFEIGTTYARPERAHWRGVAIAPAEGGRLVVHQRTPKGTLGEQALTAAGAP